MNLHDKKADCGGKKGNWLLEKHPWRIAHVLKILFEEVSYTETCLWASASGINVGFAVPVFQQCICLLKSWRSAWAVLWNLLFKALPQAASIPECGFPEYNCYFNKKHWSKKSYA